MSSVYEEATVDQRPDVLSNEDYSLKGNFKTTEDQVTTTTTTIGPC